MRPRKSRRSPTSFRTRDLNISLHPPRTVSTMSEECCEFSQTLGEKSTCDTSPPFWTTSCIDKSDEQVCWKTDGDCNDPKEMKTVVGWHIRHAKNSKNMLASLNITSEILVNIPEVAKVKGKKKMVTFAHNVSTSTKVVNKYKYLTKVSNLILWPC